MRADKPKLNKKRSKVKSNLKEMCKKRIFSHCLLYKDQASHLQSWTKHL